MSNKKLFICNNCKEVYSKWLGKCDNCLEWNQIAETSQIVAKSLTALNKKGISPNDAMTYKIKGEVEHYERVLTDNIEFDRVLGGGIVPGSVVLIGGDPGIGKSTLLLQTAAELTKKYQVLYIAGEESLNQIRIRARRLNLSNSELDVSNVTNIEQIQQLVSRKNAPEILIIDSIQTMISTEVASAPGTVSQVRAVTYELVAIAKKKDISVLIVGHVTKEGHIAGPKVMEHMVDTVLYFEGENDNQFRILRSIKNRFGTTNEIGIFEMTIDGLKAVENPSELFLENRDSISSGISVFAGVQGLRTILVEIQALVADSQMANPRRSAIGTDINRLSMIIAVLNAKYGINCSNKEVYLNVAGGIKVQEPAADLAVALTLLSAFFNKALPKNCIIFGEIGLSGEIRNVSFTDNRLKEAQKLGFSLAIIPYQGKNQLQNFQDLEIKQIKQISDLSQFFQQNKNGIKSK